MRDRGFLALSRASRRSACTGCASLARQASARSGVCHGDRSYVSRNGVPPEAPKGPTLRVPRSAVGWHRLDPHGNELGACRSACSRDGQCATPQHTTELCWPMIPLLTPRPPRVCLAALKTTLRVSRSRYLWLWAHRPPCVPCCVHEGGRRMRRRQRPLLRCQIRAHASALSNLCGGLEGVNSGRGAGSGSGARAKGGTLGRPALRPPPSPLP